MHPKRTRCIGQHRKHNHYQNMSVQRLSYKISHVDLGEAVLKSRRGGKKNLQTAHFVNNKTKMTKFCSWMILNPRLQSRFCFSVITTPYCKLACFLDRIDLCMEDRHSTSQQKKQQTIHYFVQIDHDRKIG